MKSTLWMMLMLILSVIQIFYNGSLYKEKLTMFITMRVFRWMMINLEVAGYYYDGLFKSGIYNPEETYFDFPAIAVAKTGFEDSVELFINSTEVVLKSFDKRSDIERIYDRSYITNYCDFYDEIKGNHAEGLEKYPCSQVFKNYQEFVRCFFLVSVLNILGFLYGNQRADRTDRQIQK